MDSVAERLDQDGTIVILVEHDMMLLRPMHHIFNTAMDHWKETNDEHSTRFVKPGRVFA